MLDQHEHHAVHTYHGVDIQILDVKATHRKANATMGLFRQQVEQIAEIAAKYGIDKILVTPAPKSDDPKDQQDAILAISFAQTAVERGSDGDLEDRAAFMSELQDEVASIGEKKLQHQNLTRQLPVIDRVSDMLTAPYQDHLHAQPPMVPAGAEEGQQR